MLAVADDLEKRGRMGAEFIWGTEIGAQPIAAIEEVRQKEMRRRWESYYDRAGLPTPVHD